MVLIFFLYIIILTARQSESVYIKKHRERNDRIKLPKNKGLLRLWFLRTRNDRQNIGKLRTNLTEVDNQNAFSIKLELWLFLVVFSNNNLKFLKL